MTNILNVTLKYFPMGFCIYKRIRHRGFIPFQADDVTKVGQTKVHLYHTIQGFGSDGFYLMVKSCISIEYILNLI